MARNRTGAKNHIHRYFRLEDRMWYCSLSDCTHYLPLNYKGGSPIGRASICWQCANEMILDENSMKMDRPICITCRMKNDGIKPFDLDEYMAQKRIENAKSKLTESNELETVPSSDEPEDGSLI